MRAWRYCIISHSVLFNRLFLFGSWFVVLKMFCGGGTFCVQMVDGPLVCAHNLYLCSIIHRLNHSFTSVYFAQNHDVLAYLTWSYWDISSLVGVNGVLGEVIFHKNIPLLIWAFICIFVAILLFTPYYDFHQCALQPLPSLFRINLLGFIILGKIPFLCSHC